MARELPEKSTPIVHEIIEKLASAKLSVYEFKIIMAVIRKTYGWNKKSDWISGSQLEEATGIMRHNCHKTVSALLKKCILLRQGRAIGVNKRVDEWRCEDGKRVPLGIVSPEIVSPEIVSQGIVSVEILDSIPRDTKIVSLGIHTKENKETITKESIVDDEKGGQKKYSEEAMILADGLLKCILHNNAKFKHDGKTTERWAEEVDRMMRIDKRSFDDIKTVIRFSQGDPFWNSNILSAKKMREKFDTLWMQSKRGSSKGAKKIFFTTKSK